ncbi:unnamed protein product [Urochloa decumbens]|uniref:Uncharacterized protein n=1 Tax=Urochloa decumbens TaxID=240449 RepID=A0ABC8VXS7_9POAL
MAGLAPKLGDLLMAEYVVQKGLKPDIESLSMELVMMNAALEDASRVPPEQLTQVEKLWARKVRELSYDMEDVVDDFILRVAGGNSATDATDANVFKKILGQAAAMVKKVKDRHQISDKVKDIKKLSNELAELRAKYTVRGAGAVFAASTGIDPRVLNLYKKESDLVGIEESREKVIRMLSIRTKDDDAHAHASEQSLKIVSIVGVGGLGKTTLAKTGCPVLRLFQFTDEPCPQQLPQFLLTTPLYMDAPSERASPREARPPHLFVKLRYFIVVDDIWDVGSWEAIRYALKDNNCGSRIIMTTRNFEVVTKVEKVYRLKPLSDGNSRKLFYKRIQSQEGESLDDVLGELSSKIIDKCGGVPLAIIAIASLLVERPCEDWSKVYDSIGFGNGDNTTKILSYSYYDLPAYLKPILLHLSIFPEDYIFDTKGMIWMWIAEGFVHLDKEEGSLFEVGERYFKELVNRSMIQPIEDKDGRVLEEFRIHDIVLDLIRKLLKDEDFITILDSREQHSSLDSLRREKKSGMTRLEGKLSHLDLFGSSWPPGYTVGSDSFKNLRFCSVGTTLKFHKGAMPRLEHLHFEVYAGYYSWEEDGVLLEQFPTKDVNEDLDLGLDNLLSLEKVDVQVDCSGATTAEAQEVEAVVTRAVENHPNHPTIQMDRLCEENILSDEGRVAQLQQNIEEHCPALEFKDEPDAFFIAELRSYRLLQKAVISIDCAGASMCEVEKVEAALRHAAEAHRNHPIIQLIRTNTNKMVSSSDHPDTELDDDHDDSPDNSISKLQLRN